ncbi:MAG: bifunctional UDP-sugar hydrolase/5'-nucleotidase [Elusimicrobiales bacterium]
MKNLITALLLCLPLSAWSLTVSVYHTSDVHGWYSARPAKWDKENSTRTIGGFPALAALVKADKNPYILLDSGDTFQGTPEGTLTRGMATAKLMKQLGYSASVVGNHDYDYTEASLRAMIKESAFPWLGANVYVKETGAPADYLQPYTIVKAGGKRIAVIGVAGEHTVTSTLPLNVKHLEFRDAPAAAARLTKELRDAEKADAVIVLAHDGLGQPFGLTDMSAWVPTEAQASSGTLAIARASRADVVIGGHIHSALPAGYRDPVSGVLLAESGSTLTHTSRVTLDFDDKSGKLKATAVELVPLWTDVTGEDKAVAATIKGFNEQVQKEMGKQVSESAVDLGPSKAGLDSDIGNWFTDAMRRQSGADVAFQNTAGIRSDMKAGKITVRDVFQVMPFENTLVKLTLTGEQIRRLMADNTQSEKGFSKLQVSGLTVTFRKPYGDPAGVTLERGGKPVADTDKFSVATNNYLTTGGTGGRVFNEDKSAEDTMLPIRELLMTDIAANPVKALPEGGRLIRAD